MREVELRSTHLMRVWWLVFWRGTLGGLLLGFCVGVIIAAVAAFTGHFHTGEVQQSARIAGVLVGIIWNINVVRMALEKEYRGFRLALIDTTGREPPATF